VNERSEERRAICIGATGNASAPNVHEKGRVYSFFDLKGDVESLLSAFDLPALRIDDKTLDYYHSGRSARVIASNKTIAYFGQLHPDVAATRKLKQEIYVAELYLEALLEFPLRSPRYQPLSRFPAVDRDFSFVFADSVRFERIESAVRALNIAELTSFKPVETFRGGSVPAGKYSVLLRAQFQSAERTLRDDEVAQWSAQIIKALEAIGGSLRS